MVHLDHSSSCTLSDAAHDACDWCKSTPASSVVSVSSLTVPPFFLVDSFDLGAMGSAPASPIHPRPSVVGPNQPPPLQRVLPSKIAPATPGMGPPRLQPVPPIFTRQGSQGSGFPRLSLVRGAEGRGGEGCSLHWGPSLLSPASTAQPTQRCPLHSPAPLST